MVSIHGMKKSELLMLSEVEFMVSVHCMKKSELLILSEVEVYGKCTLHEEIGTVDVV